MATTNPFDLLDADLEDINQLVAAKPLKVEKAAPVQASQAASKQFKGEKAAPVQASQAVKEAKNGPGGGRGGGGRRDGGRVFNRGRGDGGYNRDSRNNGPPADGSGGYRRSEEGDGARRGGYAGGYRRGGDSGDSRRNFDRHSGTGHGKEFKRDGGGRHNWGTTEDEIPPVNEEATAVVEKDLPLGAEGEATDADLPVGGEGEATHVANKERPVEVPEIQVMSLDEYEKILEEKKKALQATKVEERKVDTKVFDSMQQLSSKKSNNDDVFIKLGTEKDKRTVERDEKTKKSVSINEFLKPANGERYRGGYRGGRGGRGPREGADQRNGEAATPKTAAPKFAAPKIEDTAQFPTLGK